MPVPQDQATPIPVRNGQQALRADQHPVGRGGRGGLGAAVTVAADHAADVAARCRRRRRRSKPGDADVQENHAAHAHVPGLVLRRRHTERDQVLITSYDKL